MNTLTERYQSNFYQDEQQLYSHLLELVQARSSEDVINNFYNLFIRCSNYPDIEITRIMERMAIAPQATENFNHILNRCCHILINRWQTQLNKKDAIVTLIKLFEEVEKRPNNAVYGERKSKKLWELVKKFTESEQYFSLKRLALVMETPPTVAHKNSETTLQEPLRVLIPRYPFLYKHCLVSQDSSFEHQQAIKSIQRQKQKQFDIELSQYVTYQVKRILKASQNGGGVSTLRSPEFNQQNLVNPTLLNDRELFTSLKHYIGKVECGYTYRDYAKHFVSHTSGSISYKEFKDTLYEYLITSFSNESSLTQKKFSTKLYKQLELILPNNDDKDFSEFLLMRTCNQILNFLIVESTQKPQHYLFMDLLGNIGPVLTVGLFLKLTLICNHVKPNLEKRFAILFNHYEGSNRDGLGWLINSLENMNLALSTNFGSVDLSFIR